MACGRSSWPKRCWTLDEAAVRIVDELTENIYPPVVLQEVIVARFSS